MLTHSPRDADVLNHKRARQPARACAYARALSLFYRTTAVKDDKTLTLPDRSYFYESTEHPKTSYVNTRARARTRAHKDAPR